MALTRLQYLNIFHAAIGHAFIFARSSDRREISNIFQGLADFVPNGTNSILGQPVTQADRLECIRIVFNLVWTNLLGRTYDGHGIRHFMVDQGIPYNRTEDVPEMSVPTV